MTTSPDLIPRNVQGYSASASTSLLGEYLESSAYTPTLTGEPTGSVVPADETTCEYLPYESRVLKYVQELWERKRLAAFWGQRGATLALTEPREVNVGISTQDFGIYTVQDPITEETSAGSFNLGAIPLPFGAEGEGLWDYVKEPETATVPLKLGVTSGTSVYAFPHNSESLFEEIKTYLSQSWSGRLISRSTEILDRTEVESRLQALETSGQAYLSHRIRVLQESDEEDEEDIPLKDQAVLGFLDFMETVFAEEIDLGLTSAQGWLCAQWTSSDHRILVVWFKNRVDSMLTAFDPERKVLGHIGGDPRASNQEGASQLLVQEKFFSWRQEPLV